VRQLGLFDSPADGDPTSFVAVCECRRRYVVGRSAPDEDWPKNVHMLAAVATGECERRGHADPELDEDGLPVSALMTMQRLAPWVFRFD
jgi:hypothetical protein